MAAAPEELARLRRTARRLLWGALVCLLLPALAWLGAALAGGLAPAAGGHMAQLLSALLVLYVAPVGVVLLILGLLAGGWARWLGRSRKRPGLD